MDSSTRSERADALTVIFLAAAAFVAVLLATYLRVTGTFRDGGIAWTISIDEQPISATADSGTTAVEGIVKQAMIFASNVDTVSIAAIIAAITLWALAATAVIGAVALVAWNFLRGRVFVQSNLHAFNVAGWTLTLGPVTNLLFEHMGANGVTAALGINEVTPELSIQFWSIMPIFATGVAAGLLSIPFRRGIRLQRETEGLV